MIDAIDSKAKKIKKIIDGKTISVKPKIKLYAHNGARFDSYIVLE